SDEKAVNLLAVCIGLSTITSVLLWFAFQVWGRDIALLFGAPDFEFWLKLSPLCIWATGVWTALRLWKSRRDDFRSISVSRVVDTSALVTTQTGLGLGFQGMLGGLLVGPFIARFAAVLSIGLSTLRNDGELIRRSLNWQVAREQAIRFIRFPVYDTPASTLSSISREMPAGMLGMFFVTQWVGFYSIAYRILSVPVQMLGGAIAQVYLPVARDAAAAGRLDKLSLSIFGRLLGVAMTPMIIVAIAAPELISVILGPQWVFAGEMLAWLTPSMLAVFVASPLSEIYSILERQQEKLVFNVALFATRVASLGIGGLLGDPILAVALYSVSGAVFWALQSVWLLNLSSVPSGTIAKQIFAELLRGIPFILFISAIQYRYNSPMKLTAATFVAIALFFAFRWKEFLGPGKSRQKLF
ncbi:MAG: oligosaccharide flippase family protein, partial [Gammaproteobacteria bacterium]|nr:oligosaccharide flippase family protein [Gammaproteobacteria bacterium]